MRRLSAALAAAALALLGALAARAAFDDLGAGARAPGLGGAFVPIADDVYALYYNPAGLGLLERPQLGTSYTALYPGLRDGSSLSTSFLGYAHPLSEGRRGTLAASWTSMSLSSLYREDTLSAGYGRRWLEFGDGDEFYAGGALKYLRSGFGSFPESGNAVPTGGVAGGGASDPVLKGRTTQSALDADAGALVRFARHYAVGLDLVHLARPDVSYAGDGDRLPLIAKLGLGYRSLLSNVALQYESSRAPSGARDQRVAAAAERWFPRLFVGDFGVRGALAAGSRDTRELSMGLSYRSRRFGADYALSLPLAGASATVSSHRIALNFRFGRATEEEESLELVLEAMRQLKGGRPSPPKLDPTVADAQRRTLEELLAQARAGEAHAQYAQAADSMGRALTVAPGEKALVERYGRLSFVSQQIRQLPGYRDDPADASLHLGVIAYLGGDGLLAVRKVSEALALSPQRKDIESFLSQLETASGVKRRLFEGAKRPDRDAAIQLTRANAALEDGRYDEAVTLSLAALRADPDSAQAWENLGTAYFALNSYDDSLKAWNKALSLEKSSAVRAAIKGYIKSVARARERRPSRRAPLAPAPVQTATPLPARPRLTPQQSQELFNQAIDSYTHGRLQQAKEQLEQILAADPDDAEAQKALRRVRSELP